MDLYCVATMLTHCPRCTLESVSVLALDGIHQTSTLVVAISLTAVRVPHHFLDFLVVT